MDKKYRIFGVLALGLFLRLALSFFGTLALDQNSFIAWGHRASELGFSRFYDSWSDYLPGFIYILSLLSKLERALPIPNVVLYKLPAILADLGTGYLIYRVVNELGGKGKRALFASTLYLANIAVFANSALWGQVDSLTSFFSLLAIWSFSNNIYLSSFSLAVGMLIKPQAVFMLPVIFYLFYKRNFPIKDIVIYGLVGVATVVLAFLPFASGRSILPFIVERVSVTLNQYPYTSVNAFNFWAFWGFWKPDTGGVVSLKIVGYILALATSAISYISIVRNKRVKENVRPYIFSAIFLLINYLFFTRIHERHALPVLAPLAVSAAFISSYWVPYLAISVIYVANLTYAYVWITQDYREIFPHGIIFIFSLVGVLSYFWLTFVAKDINFSAFKLKIKPKSYMKQVPKMRMPDWVIILVLGFSLITRVAFLPSPVNEYFDEVYHAFTARVMLHNDPKAWEWWNESPPGFAYEWTHPPLAKEGMVLGMSIFGENAFGWRIPGAILGAGTVYLTYLIARKLFNDKSVGVLAAGVMALDGLTLVMSRIGMNDMYLLFAMLSAYYFFLSKKHFSSALFLGLAASSKWSTMWFLPILAVSHFVLKRKFEWRYIWYFIIPAIVYLATYIPMFVTGHGFEIFTGVQKQMWWYHTRLDATHPYTSPWWSWPFLIRPIWLYTSGLIDGKIANIYAMGNPIVFWSGIVSAFYIVYEAINLKDKRIGLVAFSYFAFFAPWAMSPRIMFLYHYLPSIPFMSICIALVLRRYKGFIPHFFIIAGVVFLYFYPHWTGISVPEALDKSYYWFPSWR